MKTQELKQKLLKQSERHLIAAASLASNQVEREEILNVHKLAERLLVFIGEIAPDKTSAPNQGEPLTPDPACPHCEGIGNGIGSVFDRCICTYGGAGKPPIMDEDDARKHDQKQANATLEHNLACMVSDYENGNIAGGRLRWAAIKADLRGLS